MSNLSEVFKDHIVWFNQCNIDKRPRLDLKNIEGIAGNINDILINYNQALKEQGFIAESNYFGQELYHFNALKLKELNMNYPQAMQMILSMTNSSLEVLIKLEKEEDAEPYINNNNTFEEKGINCYGRTSIFYAKNPKELQHIINNEGFEELIKKDKLGMTSFDHFLLTKQMKTYARGMMNLIINATEEEIKEVMNNSFFSYSAQDSLSSKVKYSGISNSLYYALLKSTEDNSEKYINDYTNQIIDILHKANFSKKELSDIVLNIFGNIDDFKYLKKINHKYEYIINNVEDNLIKELTKMFGQDNPELKAIVEKKKLTNILIPEEIQEIKVKRRL